MTSVAKSEATCPSPKFKCPLTGNQVKLLRENGLVTVDQFLQASVATDTLETARKLRACGKLTPAGMNRGDGNWKESRIRGDLTLWITSMKQSEVPPVFLDLFGEIRNVRRQLQRECPELGLGNKLSMQLAYYPSGGSKYTRHSDAFKTDTSNAVNVPVTRKVTALFYLNSSWCEEHGGKLRAYIPESYLPFTENSLSSFPSSFALKKDVETSETYCDVAPLFNRLLLFQSEDIEHEVLPSFSDRYALTVWMYGHNGDTISSVLMPGLEKLPHEAPVITSGMNMLRLGDIGSERLVMSYKAQPLPTILSKLSEDEGKVQKIFVSIASYRDPECQHTIRSLFSSAEFPERIFVGVCMQYDRSVDAHCFSSFSCRPNQVRVMHIDHTDAKGPSWARHMIEKMWDGEDYVLQLDSHMRLRPHWDSFLIHALDMCPSTKPILSSYPLAYELPNQVPYEDIDGTLLCASHFDENGILRTVGRRLLKQNEHITIIPSLFWASGFSFTRAGVIHEVPYDPMPHLFFGEEPAMSARLWTSGYDFFATSEAVVYHLWKRNYRPNFQELETKEKLRSKLEARESVKKLLNGEGPVRCSAFGLGSTRSLEAFEQFVGVSFSEGKITDRGKFGGQSPTVFASFSPHKSQEKAGKITLKNCGNGIDPNSSIGKVMDVLRERGLT